RARQVRGWQERHWFERLVLQACPAPAPRLAPGLLRPLPSLRTEPRPLSRLPPARAPARPPLIRPDRPDAADLPRRSKARRLKSPPEDTGETTTNNHRRRVPGASLPSTRGGTRPSRRTRFRNF